MDNLKRQLQENYKRAKIERKEQEVLEGQYNELKEQIATEAFITRRLENVSKRGLERYAEFCPYEFIRDEKGELVKDERGKGYRLTKEKCKAFVKKHHLKIVFCDRDYKETDSLFASKILITF